MSAESSAANPTHKLTDLGHLSAACLCGWSVKKSADEMSFPNAPSRRDQMLDAYNTHRASQAAPGFGILEMIGALTLVWLVVAAVSVVPWTEMTTPRAPKIVEATEEDFRRAISRISPLTAKQLRIISPMAIGMVYKQDDGRCFVSTGTAPGALASLSGYGCTPPESMEPTPP